MAHFLFWILMIVCIIGICIASYTLASNQSRVIVFFAALGLLAFIGALITDIVILFSGQTTLQATAVKPEIGSINDLADLMK